MLLGEVGEMEVAGEGTGDLHGAVHGPFGHQGRDLVGRRLLTPGRDHRLPEPFYVGEEVGAAVFGDHLTQ
ncbi:hypothetical protein Misp03_11740 [Microbispora sp. NBRC 16548]|nr:hypothetical protein Misp03_11740 [Microbispora sp. NBRC 16548]